MAQMRDGLVERSDFPGGTGLHHSALHGGEDEDGETVEVGLGGKAVARGFEKASDSSGPGGEVGRDAGVGGEIIGLDFESEAADGASVAIVGCGEALAIALKDSEDAVEGVFERGCGGFDDDRMQTFEVAVENGEKQGFLAFEEVIKAAAVGLSAVEEFGHAGGGEAFLPEEMAGGFEQARSCGRCLAFHLIDRSSKSWGGLQRQAGRITGR